MKANFLVAVALSSVVFAAPEVYAGVEKDFLKDLTRLQYSNNLPIAEAIANIERREAVWPIKDNRNLHYNTNSRMPIAMAMPEQHAATADRREASDPIKDNRNLHYNVNNKMPIVSNN
ncbi:hypothetical protein IF1G_06868 [Cordyceps javanica]|uniref:Uncharacterized protein n=1 Tax=Cordyceps javanica TaxID=43265 RepID=A0A545UZG8_9HYPO|nr:hypothetical protein IF1G_06868 [Cordyceps javanica]TQW06720.1 hypothetical protein IF2G_06142 [Cordyceps javanica]